MRNRNHIPALPHPRYHLPRRLLPTPNMGSVPLYPRITRIPASPLFFQHHRSHINIHVRRDYHLQPVRILPAHTHPSLTPPASATQEHDSNNVDAPIPNKGKGKLVQEDVVDDEDDDEEEEEEEEEDDEMEVRSRRVTNA